MNAEDFYILDKHIGTTIVNDNGIFLGGAYKTRYKGAIRNHLLLYTGLDRPTPVRIQSGCLTGDIFGDTRCDCHEQLLRAKEFILRKQNGLVIYTIEDDGRGRGTLAKLKVYYYKEAENISSEEACRRLGLTYERRDYVDVVMILRDLGISEVQLLSQNAQKVAALRNAGIEIGETITL